ncbi:MAG: DUF2871 domain-containing protein [Candidatus Saccharimonadales bacterium]
MKKLYNAALFYLVAGLLSGLFYREYTRGLDFEGFTQLSVLHTHLLALGMLFFLIVIVMEKVFTLSSSKWFKLFFWHYNAGLILTASMMVVHGIIVIGGGESSGMTAGISGLGHILLTVGLGFLFAALKQRLFAKTPAA